MKASDRILAAINEAEFVCRGATLEEYEADIIKDRLETVMLLAGFSVIPTLQVTAEPPPRKFILLYFRNQGITTLVRKSDGMFIGSVMANRCGAGEDPSNVQIRLFLDNDHALRYLKEVVAGSGAEFEEQEGDSRIIQPPIGGIH